ncbi:hypothetical protein BU17DRAFT_48894, partial [Hysterangium stoloniferum]
LVAIFAATICLGYHPVQWRTFTTITLPKLNKPDYMLPKAYCPIALENSLSKVVE